MHAYLHCHGYVQRPQGLVQAASLSGSRRRAPGALRPQRGVTQSIPIDGLVATPWSAVDRGTARVTPRPKPLRSVLEKGYCTLFTRAQARGRREWTWLRARYRKYPTFSVATGLKPERNIPLHFSFPKDSTSMT